MTTNKHIRGPWRVAKGGWGLYDVYDADGNIVAKEKIAEVAHIIAAAPDLLAVCKRVVQFLGVVDRQANIYDPRVNDALQKAIAKATGLTPGG